MKLLSATLFGLTTASLTNDYQWHSWKQENGISFKTKSEESRRYNIFSASRNFVNVHNSRAAQGLETYTVTLNKFAALEPEEFEERYLNKRMQDPKVGIVTEYQCDGNMYSNSGNSNPSELSWVNGRTGYVSGNSRVTSVKDQGSCGSCWSFATTAVLEATMCENDDKDCDSWTGLAPQQLVDCMSYNRNINLNPYDDHGCSGGFITNGVRSANMYGGVMNWDDYPYISGSTKTEQECVYDDSISNLNISSGCKILPANDEITMADAVANVGPLGIGINASGRGFSLYSGGVYSDPSCNAKLNHAVTVTGYGTLGDQDYFEVKNSWGAAWGDQGFINIARNAGGMCGIGLDSMFNLA